MYNSISQFSVACTRAKGDVTKAIWLESRQCKHVKTKLNFFYILGPQYTRTEELMNCEVHQQTAEKLPQTNMGTYRQREKD